MRKLVKSYETVVWMTHPHITLVQTHLEDGEDHVGEDVEKEEEEVEADKEGNCFLVIIFL